MINKKTAKFQLSRSKFIEESRAVADLRLQDYRFLKGEIVMVNYYKESTDFWGSNIGVLIAIGIKDGKGKECYKLLQTGKEIIVRDITDVEPDVSSLVHSELYIFKDPNGVWNYLYKLEDEPQRRIEKINDPGPFVFISLADGYRYFYHNQECKREDDFLSSDKVETILQGVLGLGSDDLSVTSLNGNLFKAGETKDIELLIEAKDKDGNSILDGSKIFINGEEVTLDERGIYVLEDLSTSQDVDVEVQFPITDDITNTVRKSIHIEFGYIFYYGRIPGNWTPSASSIALLENKRLHYKTDFVWDDIALDNQSIAFAYPRIYGNLSHIFDVHGIDYSHDYDIYDENFIIEGTRYFVYVKRGIVDVAGFKQRYTFVNSDKVIDESSALLDIATAWKLRNTFNGLVTLNEEGKIPEELYNLNASASYTKITSIVDSYPEEGMVRGEIYYNTTTKKLYTAVSSTEGIISDPEVGLIYVCGTDYYAWDGERLRTFDRVTTEKIDDLKEILR